MSLNTIAYRPGESRKSGSSWRTTTISGRSFIGATLKSYETLRIAHTSSILAVFAFSRLANVIALTTRAITRIDARSGALVMMSRLNATKEIAPSASTVWLGLVIAADIKTLLL